MSGKYIYEVMSNYPQLIGEDNEVWDSFIRKYPHRFETVEYNVKVGIGGETFPGLDLKTFDNWALITKKRIDVIGWNLDCATIIEVKKIVGLPTLGQVLGNHVLYSREHPGIFLNPSLIVCSLIDVDSSYVFDHYGISCIVV